MFNCCHAILSMLTVMSLSTPFLQAVEINWLGDDAPKVSSGVSFGVPWPAGQYTKDATFTITDAKGVKVPTATWPMAYWPDGSVKWTGCAVVADTVLKAPFHITDGAALNGNGVHVKNLSGHYMIDTGGAAFMVAKSGDHVVADITINGKVIANNVSLVAHLRDSPEPLATNVTTQAYLSNFTKVTIEQETAVRVVVKAEGRFVCRSNKRTVFPFTLRLYFYQGAQQVKSVFSFVYDGDIKKDFIAGLGMTVEVPLREHFLNRHVMFAGEADGVWHEPTKLFTALTGRLPNIQATYAKQLLGEPVAIEKITDQQSLATLKEIATWDAFKLQQVASDGFTIHKRTGAHSSWVKADHGGRARGMAFAGDTTGGVLLGFKDFWQTFPSALNIDGMSTDVATITAWFWSPEAPPMDMRHYSDRGHGLDGAYEDYEEGHSTPVGIARTFEVILQVCASVPTSEQFNQLATLNSDPPMLACSPEYYHQMGAFGKWSIPDRSTETKRWIEDRIDYVLDFYKKEIDQRRWYGFWDYGDVMHQYDIPRHNWKYDVGGFAWQNTELIPDVMLWYSYLRSGRKDVYRMAEAMTRHTQEVDVYHVGPMKGLGSRHNVSHWGGGAKEVRIAQAGLKRFYYYLTTDERMGDLLNEVIDADEALVITNPLRKLLPKDEHKTHIRIGPDWTALVANWFAAWERTGDKKYYDYIMTGMNNINAMPNGLFTADFFGYDPATKVLKPLKGKFKKPAHMISIFGGAETMMELNDLIDNPQWQKTWLTFSERYSWSSIDWKKKTGQKIGSGGFPIWHSRLAAYAAYKKKDKVIATRAWDEFLYADHRGKPNVAPVKSEMFTGTETLNPVSEVFEIETNHCAQWVLNAIENLELIGDYLPNKIDHTRRR